MQAEIDQAALLVPGGRIMQRYTSQATKRTMYQLVYRTQAGRVLQVVGHTRGQCNRALQRRLEGGHV